MRLKHKLSLAETKDKESKHENTVSTVLNIIINRTSTVLHCMQNRWAYSMMFCFDIHHSRVNGWPFYIKCLKMVPGFHFFQNTENICLC